MSNIILYFTGFNFVVQAGVVCRVHNGERNSWENSVMSTQYDELC